MKSWMYFNCKEENLEEIVAWWVGPPAVVGPPFLPTPTRGRSARTGKWLVDVKSLKVCGGWVPARLCRCVFGEIGVRVMLVILQPPLASGTSGFQVEYYFNFNYVLSWFSRGVVCQ